MKFRLEVSEIKDIIMRENFRKLQERIDEEPFLNGNFKHFDITTTGAVTDELRVHGLGFLPKDAFVTYKNPETATVTFDYSLFTKTNIAFTTSGAVNFRCFVGRFEEVK